MTAQLTALHAYQRVDVPLTERARDLLAELTGAEKLSMLHQFVPAVPRLGLAAFHTGCEALHGVAWLGRATTFPQAVGLGATWDTELLRAVGEVTAVEVRAKRAEDPTVSLNTWAPVVNTLRHPLWGRNEEGYAEDPHLVGELATAFCRGMRGDHERVWRTVPTLKHFLGYNNETDRSVTDSRLSPQILHEEELAAFRAPVEAGVAGAMMLAYNRVNGTPAHIQPELVAEARSWAPESLAVVSDAGAPTFVVTTQRAEPDGAHAAGALVRAGLDSFTDDDANSVPTVTNLQAALDAGLLTWAEVDAAVLRVLELRIRTGELDGELDPYAEIGADSIDLPASRALAREAVAKSVVVLRNDAGLLPLAAPARVAVVGPMADCVLTDWYAGTPPYSVGIAGGFRDRYPDAVVDVVEGSDRVALRSTLAQRYVRAEASGDVVADAVEAGEDTYLDVTDWGDGVLTLRSLASGKLLNGAAWPVRADAERVGGWVVQESYRRHVHPDGSWSLLHLGSGRWLRVMRDSGLLAAEAVELGDAERFVVRTVRSGLVAVAAAAAAADVVVVAVGNDPHLSGRETVDRPHLWLPDCAVELWRTAVEANPAAVLTVVSSFPYVLGPGVADAATVVWTSHGGQELGHGLVDVLSGDREPSGRLAQTWPADPSQVGDLFDYDTRRQHATYRHSVAEPLFAFGHGCTYSTVSYESIVVATGLTVAGLKPSLRQASLVPAPFEPLVTAVVTVRNTGNRAAEELVQVYVGGDLPLPLPRRLLVAHQRVRLEPGESRAVSLTFPVARLAVWDESARVPGAPSDWLHEGALVVQPGTYRVWAGPSAAEEAVREELTVQG